MVSVIVPVYNAEKTLNRCVESIIKQKYKDIQLILVDDCSMDGSWKLMQELSIKYSQIKIFHLKENKGPSAARNKGLKYASGEWVSFVDSDDYLDELFYSELIATAERDHAEIVISSTLQVDSQGKIIRELTALPCYKADSAKLALQLAYGGKDDLDFIYNLGCNKLYRRSLFEKVSFPEGRLQEDAFIMPYLLIQCSKVSCAIDSVYYYVDHDDSISHMAQKEENDLKRRLDLVYMYKNHIKLYKSMDNPLYKRSMMNLLNNIITIYKFHYNEFRRDYKKQFGCLRKDFLKYIYIVPFSDLGGLKLFITFLIFSISPSVYLKIFK